MTCTLVLPERFRLQTYPMRLTAQRLALALIFLCACQRGRSLDTVVEDIAAGRVRDAATAREAIALASTHELVAIRRGLVDAILHLDGMEFKEELRRAVVDPNPALRLQAARAFERWGTVDDLGALDKAADIQEEGATPESAGATAANAAVRIRLESNPEPAQRALTDLQSVVAQVRVSGAVNLGYYRWPPSIVPLQQAVMNETDELVRAMAACALGSFDAHAIAPVLGRLENLLGAPPMISRRCAVKALSVSDQAETATLLARAIAERDTLTRRWVIEGLDRLHAVAQYQRVILFASRRDQDVGVRAEAVRALAPTFDASVEKAWRQALTDQVPRVRAAAAHELVRRDIADVIATALNDPAWEVRSAVLIALTRRPADRNGQS
jgi:HEAT repeat protein